MQFIWLNTQGVARNEGFVVQSVERLAFEYREAIRVTRLQGEDMYGNLGTASWGFLFDPGWRIAQWQAPFEGLPISPTDRDRIIQNVKTALAFMGGKVRFNEA